MRSKKTHSVGSQPPYHRTLIAIAPGDFSMRPWYSSICWLSKYTELTSCASPEKSFAIYWKTGNFVIRKLLSSVAFLVLTQYLSVDRTNYCAPVSAFSLCASPRSAEYTALIVTNISEYRPADATVALSDSDKLLPALSSHAATAMGSQKPPLWCNSTFSFQLQVA